MSITTRLSNLEQAIQNIAPQVIAAVTPNPLPPTVTQPTNISQQIVATAQQTQTQSIAAQVDNVIAPYNKQVEIYNLKSNFAKLLSFTVNFIEENGPIICGIVGGALTGQVKIDLCIQLISNVVQDLPIEMGLLKQIVEETFTIVKNSATNTTTVTQTSEVKGKKKVGIFRSNTIKGSKGV